MMRRSTWHPDAWRIVKRAWSIRWTAAAIVATGVEFGFSVFTDSPPVPRGTFALAGILCSGFAFYARLRAQQGFDQ
jgi:hypothetical protein